MNLGTTISMVLLMVATKARPASANVTAAALLGLEEHRRTISPVTTAPLLEEEKERKCLSAYVLLHPSPENEDPPVSIIAIAMLLPRKKIGRGEGYGLLCPTALRFWF
ncbi:hypothetical protein MRB53_030613 [Persea americana]|uniref:Uncharacterized protein n=1 Tax=Persea americana TaxID=3435 RepID=A0ACC2KLM1_PERAE|nr:hypothetical protein MRB53_030613 [Persea americana]